MSRRGALLLLVLGIASLVLATRREAATPVTATAASAAAVRPELPRAELAVDPATIRDVFRFVDRPSAAVQTKPREPTLELARPLPSPEN